MNAKQYLDDITPLLRKPRRKWFAHTCKDAENGWSGPHDHIEDAARAALLAWEAEGDTCWIAQGRKLTKSEYEEQGAEYTWEVDTLNAMRLVLPNGALCGGDEPPQTLKSKQS